MGRENQKESELQRRVWERQLMEEEKRLQWHVHHHHHHYNVIYRVTSHNGHTVRVQGYVTEVPQPLSQHANIRLEMSSICPHRINLH